MNDYSKITAMYSRLSVGDEDRDGGESNSIQNQKTFLESYAKQQQLTNIKHYMFAPFINIMSEWYAKDISKKVKTGIKTKGMSGKPIMTEAAAVVRLIFALFMDGKNRNQICIHLKK